jgi:hypothetical protein
MWLNGCAVRRRARSSASMNGVEESTSDSTRSGAEAPRW